PESMSVVSAVPSEDSPSAPEAASGPGSAGQRGPPVLPALRRCARVQVEARHHADRCDGSGTDRGSTRVSPVPRAPALPSGVDSPSMTSRSAGTSRARPSAARDDEAVVAGVRITHPDRVVYPDASLTKARIARYYAAVAEHILPHLRLRPAVLVRCPDG